MINSQLGRAILATSGDQLDRSDEHRSYGELTETIEEVRTVINRGGAFLAFPAILPATLTLIEKKEGTSEARHDVAGAVLGAVGLTAFGAPTVWALHRMAVGLALVAAAASWVVVSVALYLMTESARRLLTDGNGGGARRPGPE